MAGWKEGGIEICFLPVENRKWWKVVRFLLASLFDCTFMSESSHSPFLSFQQIYRSVFALEDERR